MSSFNWFYIIIWSPASIKFFSTDKYDLKDVTNSWVHLTFKDFVENGGRDEAEPENNIIVTPVSIAIHIM